MNKTLNFSLITILFSYSILLSQIPTDYYKTANGYADDDLKSKLNQIIANHTIFPYTSSDTDIWDILKETDKDPNNSENVILVYSGVSINGDQEFNFGNGWIREHVWAKSRGNFGTDEGPGTDVHALRPLDLTTNVERNNRSFDICTNCQNVMDRWGNDTGSKIDKIQYSFEPRDAVKGDVARMLFYMVVRYEGLDGYTDLEPSQSIVPLGNNDPIHGAWPTLMEWNRIDPVDDWERNRNDIIYYSYQNNRNPFIDHPELAEHLWGIQTGISWYDTNLSTADLSDIQIKLYPNPANDIIKIKELSGKATVTIHDMLGRKVLVTKIDTNQNTIDTSQLSGMYILNISLDKKVFTKRILVN